MPKVEHSKISKVLEEEENQRQNQEEEPDRDTDDDEKSEKKPDEEVKGGELAKEQTESDKTSEVFSQTKGEESAT